MQKKIRAGARRQGRRHARAGEAAVGTLGLDVTIDHRGEGGTLHIKYKDLDQLDAVLRKLDRT